MVFQFWSKEPSREIVLAENQRLVAEVIDNRNAEIEKEKNKLDNDLEKTRIWAKLIYSIVLIGNITTKIYFGKIKRFISVSICSTIAICVRWSGNTLLITIDNLATKVTIGNGL